MDDSPVILFNSDTHQQCVDCQFVLQSRGINSHILSTPTGYALAVAGSDEIQAMREINSYLVENMIHSRQSAPAPQPPAMNSIPGLVGYVIVICIVSAATGLGLFDIDWYQQGRIDASLVYQGQWWRLVTALTLHGDPRHLLSNLGFGCLFLYFLGRYLGYGLAALGLLVSGIAGNAINVYMHGAEHFSIGASTAVFGVLGMLSAYIWKMRYFSQARWPQRLGPIFGGIALLAFTGTSGERTDIGAHLWGFAAGAVMGWTCGQFSSRLKLDVRSQHLYGGVVLVVLVFSWLAALMNA